MKTLKNHTILYDEVCPMCNLYTSAFVRSGMLDGQGRAPFGAAAAENYPGLDRERAVNEIALVNRETGTVLYGIQSLFAILGHSFPFLRPLFRLKPFAAAVHRLYKFISYNRRVIIPARAGNDTCRPTFSAHYRVLFLLFTWITTAFVLFRYSALLNPIFPEGNFYRELAVCGGQLVWQGLLVYILHPRKTMEYLGNMMTISFGGGLLLLLVMGISALLPVPPLPAAALFMGVAGLMFLEHIRRTRLLEVSGWLTVSWVAYRLFILLLIL